MCICTINEYIKGKVGKCLLRHRSSHTQKRKRWGRTKPSVSSWAAVFKTFSLWAPPLGLRAKPIEESIQQCGLLCSRRWPSGLLVPSQTDALYYFVSLRYKCIHFCSQLDNVLKAKKAIHLYGRGFFFLLLLLLLHILRSMWIGNGREKE